MLTCLLQENLLRPTISAFFWPQFKCVKHMINTKLCMFRCIMQIVKLFTSQSIPYSNCMKYALRDTQAAVRFVLYLCHVERTNLILFISGPLIGLLKMVY
jgi:hypothetical protein